MCDVLGRVRAYPLIWIRSDRPKLASVISHVVGSLKSDKRYSDAFHDIRSQQTPGGINGLDTYVGITGTYGCSGSNPVTRMIHASRNTRITLEEFRVTRTFIEVSNSQNYLETDDDVVQPAQTGTGQLACARGELKP